MITAANRLQIVSRHGVGFDNVPIAACTERRIPVTIVGAVNTVAVAEHTIFLLLAAARAGVELDVAVRRGDFSIRGRTAAVELSGRTLLVIGLGRIVLRGSRTCGGRRCAGCHERGHRAQRVRRLHGTLDPALVVNPEVFVRPA